jgi:hypothetical protein
MELGSMSLIEQDTDDATQEWFADTSMIPAVELDEAKDMDAMFKQSQCSICQSAEKHSIDHVHSNTENRWINSEFL